MGQTGTDRGNAEIAQSWVGYYLRLGRPQSERDFAVRKDDPNRWAVDAVMALQFSDPVRALEIAFIVARSTVDDWVLEILGAGPLEDLLVDDPTLLDFIALEIGSNPRLKEALGFVWQNAMDDETWTKVQRLACS
jgi:hypothetical protein